MTNGWTDIRNSDVILAMGGNPAENHPVGFRFVMEAKRQRNARLVVVDPRYQRTAAVRLMRGSTQTSLAFRWRFASMTKRKPTGWFSAGFPPMTRTASQLTMSVQPLVMAPRPKVAARLATVGPCQRRAWFS